MSKRRTPILEADAQLTFDGNSIGVTLRAYGKWHPRFSGINEPGERPTSPPEPAHYEIDSVTISSGGGSIETEIYNGLNEEALDTIAAAAREAA